MKSLLPKAANGLPGPVSAAQRTQTAATSMRSPCPLVVWNGFQTLLPSDKSVGFLPACPVPVSGDLFPFVLGHVRVSKAAASILSIIQACHKNTRGFPKPQNEGFYNINSTLVNLIPGYLLHQNLFTVMYDLVTEVITAVS